MTFIIVAFFSIPVKSQTTNNWAINWTYPNVFIENKGQFDGRDKQPGAQVLYAVDQTNVQIFFTKQGLTYYLDTRIKNKDRKKGDISKPKMLIISDYINMTWDGANPNPEIVPEEMSPDYQTYSMLSKDRKSYYDIRNIRGYKKITYKNLYPGIDVEYTVHPESGVKYALILHPGADISKVRMKYSSDKSVGIDKYGNLKIASIYGDITEHAPVSYYMKNSANPIQSQFQLNGNVAGFVMNDYDKTQTVIVDPWVQMPVLPNSKCVWELDKDSAGNIYIIGGDMPMKLQKYDSAGVLQWTYSTPWDTSNNWLGTISTDVIGNSYITSGSVAAIQKVKPDGSMAWSANGGSMDEYWTIAFNCNQTKLMVGGTRLDPDSLALSHGVIFEIDTSNGNIDTLVNVCNIKYYYPVYWPYWPYPNEVRAMSSTRDNKYYFLTLDSLGAIKQDTSTGLFLKSMAGVSSTYDFSYKTENYRPITGNAGIRAIRANNNFLYTQKGDTIDKRSLTDGSIIKSAAIPGGISTHISSTVYHQTGNNGIAVDSCGNVYVGSTGKVIKYDADLNIISEAALPFAVYDVIVVPGGNIVVCGGTGTNSSTSRTGYLQSVNMSACVPFALGCCNAGIFPVDTLCKNDSVIVLLSESAGGVWSGQGVNPVTGEFNPITAGVGTHTITYTLPCGNSSIKIVVDSCSVPDVIEEINDNANYRNNGKIAFDIYPNPARETITIELATSPNDNALAEIFSIEGKLIQSFPVLHKKSTVNLVSLFSGVYIVKVRDNNGIGIKKLIVE